MRCSVGEVYTTHLYTTHHTPHPYTTHSRGALREVGGLPIHTSAIASCMWGTEATYDDDEGGVEGGADGGEEGGVGGGAGGGEASTCAGEDFSNPGKSIPI